MKQFLRRMLLLALLCVPWVTNAQTDTLTVANGTNANSYIPFYGTWMDASQHNQIVYPASMLTDLVGDSIKGLGFYMSSNSSNAWGSTVTVRLGIASSSTLSGLDNTTSLTQVWQGTVNGQGDIWMPFSIAYPFMGGNLLVDIETTAGTWGGASFYGASQSSTTAYYSYGSYNNGTFEFLPKTSFVHVDGDFNVCLMPGNLVADIDTTQIKLSWSPAAGVDGYNVYMNDSLVGQSISDTFYVFTDLTPNTLYTFRVASDCSGSESAAIGGSYRTSCSLMQIPFFTSFENDPYGVFPPCWTRTIQAGTDPSVNTVFSHTGSQSMYLQADNAYNLFASQVVPLAGNNIKVDFWARLSSYYDGWIQAGVMTNPYQDSTFIPLLYINDMAGEWKHYNFSTHDLDANATYYVAFKYFGTGSYNSAAGAIDDITISATDGCAMPRASAFDSIDSVFVSLTWLQGSTNNNYDIAYGVTNDVDAATVIDNISDTAYTVTGLNSNTRYHFWVRNICNSGDTTLWYYIGAARTACADGMNAPVYEDFDDYNYEVPACWTVMQSSDSYGTIYPYAAPGSLSFEPMYGQPNLIAMPYIRLAADEMDIEINAQTDSYSPATLEVGYVTDLADASTFRLLGTITNASAADYEFTTDTVTADTIWIAFRATTTSQYGYAYVNSINIHHLSSCMRPDYLVIDTVGHDMAELHCNAVTGANGYELLYTTVNNVNDASAQTENSTDGSFSISSLSASTHYYTWVRTVCGIDEYSDWRQGPDFVTMCGENYCLLAIDMQDSYGDGWNGNAINVYTNGVLQMAATIDNGSSNSVQLSMCDGDTVVLTWTTGSYASETSFEISHAGAQVLSAVGTDYANGDTVSVRIGCPNCFPVSNVVAVDTLATDESVTVTWTPYSTDDTDWIISVNGVVVDAVNTNTYTINNLTPNTGYNIGVATLCGTGDTSEFTYTIAGTECGGSSCNVIVNMIDSYGDGWNGNAIALYQNGTFKGSSTLTSGTSGVANIGVCEGDSIEIRWIEGSYISETSFLILSLAGDTMYSGSASGEGYVGMTDTVACPACVSPAAINISNITSTSASLNWNTNGAATGWHVTVNSATAMIVDTIINTTPFTISGLQSATGYTVMVSSICSGDTASASVTTFITACDEITLPWFFDAMNDPSFYTYQMPPCWYSPQTYDSYGTLYPCNASSGLTIYGYSGTSCMATSPRIPSAGNNIYVRIHATSYGYNSPTMTASVMTDPTNPATYIPLVNITVEDLTEYEFTTDNVTGLSATDTVYVAFQCVPPAGYGYGYIYVNDVYVQTIPNCHRPDSIVVSNVTDNAATLTWPATGATNYTVSYGDTSFVVTGNTVNLTGLTSGTTYVVDVQGNCTTDSSLLQHATFMTVCMSRTIPWSEGFEGYANYSAPNCWTLVDQYPDYNGNISPYVYNDSYNAHTGVGSLAFSGTSVNNPMAIGPMLTGAAMNTLYVSFWIYGGGSYGFEAGFMTDPNADSTFIPLLTVPGTSYDMTQYSFQTNSITNTDSTFYFAIRYTSTASYSGSIYLDDISVILMPECSDEFASVAISDITNNSATLTWTPGLGINANSTYKVTLMDENYATESVINNATSPLNLTNLYSDRVYNVRVSLNCGGTYSAISDTISFSTLCGGLEFVYSYDSTMTASTSMYSPLGYDFYKYGYTQTIIDSAMMAAVTGDIVGFAFMPLTPNGGSYYNNMDVYMANVSESDLSTDWITPDSNHVFVHVVDNANMCYDTTGWQQFVFGQRFTWDGHSNVLISVRRGHGSYNSSDHATFAVHSDATTVGKTRYAYNDSYAYDINDPEASYAYNIYTGDFVADLKFLVCSNAEACPAPTNVTVTDIGYDHVSLQWSGPSDLYEVYLVDQSTYLIDYLTIDTNSYSYAGLQPSSLYTVILRSVCDTVDLMLSDLVYFSFITDSLPCFTPSDFENTAVTVNGATFDWTVNGEETMWNIHVWNTAFDSNYVVTGHPATVGGLAQTVTYNAAVSALCGNGIVESDYSDTIQFTTTTCQPVTGATATSVTAHTAVITWNGDAASYDLEYGRGDFGIGTGTQVNGITATSYTLTDLADEAAYTVYIRANCEGQPSAWSQVQFTTAVGIDGVNGVNVTIYPNPTTTSTTIALSGISSEVSIAIVDMNGRTVRTDAMSCEGDCVKTIEVSGLAQGAYFIRVNGEGVNMVKKLVVK